MFTLLGMLNGSLVRFGEFASWETCFEYLRNTGLGHDTWVARSFRVREPNGVVLLANEFMFNHRFDVA